MVFRQFLCFALLAGVLFTSSLSAAVRFQVDTVVEREGESKKTAELITIDGNKARIDYQMLNGDKITDGLRVITLDGGKSLVMVNDEASYCSDWSMAEFSREIGRYISNAEKSFSANLGAGKVEKTLEEPGPEILGQPTVHLRMVSSFGGKARFLVKKFKYDVEETDDIWVAPGIEMDFLERQWWSALADTGYTNIDEMSKMWNAEVLDRGAILKRTSSVHVKDLVAKKEWTNKENVEISVYEEIDAASLPAKYFSTPDCTKVSNEEMEKRVKKLFRHHFM